MVIQIWDLGHFICFLHFCQKLLVCLFSVDFLTSARHCWAAINCLAGQTDMKRYECCSLWKFVELWRRTVLRLALPLSLFLSVCCF